MAITDELRKWAQIIGVTQDSKVWELADHIDAAHRSALEKLAAQLDESEDGWVRLPVDADGVPIHVGDVVEDASVREIVERVMQIRYTLTTSGISPTVLTSIITDASQLPQKPNDYRHHHTPTVEDVLDEFFGKANLPDGTQTRAEIIAEFAAKLRLAGEGE